MVRSVGVPAPVGVAGGFVLSVRGAEGCDGVQQSSVQSSALLCPSVVAELMCKEAFGAQQPFPRQASRPSLTATAAMTRAAIGSAHDQPKRLLTPRPTSSTAER